MNEACAPARRFVYVVSCGAGPLRVWGPYRDAAQAYGHGPRDAGTRAGAVAPLDVPACGDALGRWIVVQGSPTEGWRFTGGFATALRARNHADRRAGSGGGWVTLLEAPSSQQVPAPEPLGAAA